MAPLLSLAVLSLSVVPALAQDETIWSAMMITNFGDRIPLLSPEYSVLTPVGAQQMGDLGSAFRRRYITNEGSADGDRNHTIRKISRDVIDNRQTMITTMWDVFVQQSTSAFVTGLYPPLGSDGNSSNATGIGSQLHDGSTVTGPLDGLQFPQLYITSNYDPHYMYLNASASCPSFTSSYQSWVASSNYSDLSSSSQSAIQSLESVISSPLPNTSVEYWNAYAIYDYLSFAQLHENKPGQAPVDGDIAIARSLASSLVSAVYGDRSTDSGIRTIAGQGLLSFVQDTMSQVWQNNATSFNLNIASTGDEALVALFSVLGLPDMSLDFTSLPNLASAVSFELYSEASAPLSDTQYPFPASEDLRVRFLFQNGTNSSLSEFPILGRMKSDPNPTLEEFVREANQAAALTRTSQAWCNACRSSVAWCAAYTGLNSDDGWTFFVSGNNSHGLRPSIAGVIGAMVTLAVIGLVMIAAMLLFGVRFAKTSPGVIGGKFGRRNHIGAAAGAGAGGRSWLGHHKRQSSGLGGFKGAEKLASDVDLPKGGAAAGGFGASVVPSEGQHRRVESWELREARDRRVDEEGGGRVMEGREHV